MRCDIIANGIVLALKGVQLKVPVVIRLQVTHIINLNKFNLHLIYLVPKGEPGGIVPPPSNVEFILNSITII